MNLRGIGVEDVCVCGVRILVTEHDENTTKLCWMFQSIHIAIMVLVGPVGSTALLFTLRCTQARWSDPS